MLASQSQSRNYTPDNVTQNFDEILQNLAKQKLEEDENENDQQAESSGYQNGDHNKNGLTLSVSIEPEKVVDVNIPQITEIVNMKDEEYEEGLEQMDTSKNLPLAKEEAKPKVENDPFKIKNIDTGEVYDLKSQETEAKVNTNNDGMMKGVPWNTFWKNVRKTNEALWDAAEAGNKKKVEDLIDKKMQSYPAEINSKALDDWTALHMSANAGHYDIVELLLNFGANIEAKTSMSRTPLHISCMRGHTHIIQLLVSRGADVNATDNDFCTPLHIASEHGFADVVIFLLDKQAQVPPKNHAGLTCIDVANSVEIRKMFESRGLVNENTISGFGRTYMDDALLYNSRLDMIGKLLMVGNMNSKLQKLKSNPGKPGANKNEPRFSNVRIHNWGRNDEAKSPDGNEKIGPQSFICHLMLGKGSFGEVFLVEKISNKKLYAMKVLRKDKILNQNLTRYAKTERNVLSIMNHPFIVGLNSAFQTENKLYLILEYCPGGDLGSLITKKRRFPEDVAKIYAAEITLALENLHNKDIIFRDLKPDNVVLDAEGHAMLTDFGLSKEGVKAELQKSFCGSVAYLAPEMLRRSGHNKTVDWYLLGVLIYEMLVGMPPYFSSNREELFENIKKAQLKLPKNLSEEAKHLITHLLKRDPAKRLGAQNDAADIKNHPWFRDIDWQDAMRRKLRPPLPDKKLPKLNGLANHKLEEATNNNRNYIQGWSFINKDDV